MKKIEPINIITNSSNQVLITDYGDNTVKIFDNSNLEVPTFVIENSFNFNQKSFSFPDLCLNNDETMLFISDPNNHKIHIFDTTDDYSLIKSIKFFNKDDKFDNPSGIAIINNELHIVDKNNNRIVVLNINDEDFSLIQIYGTKGHENNKGLYHPTDILYLGGDNVYITDTDNNRLVSFEFYESNICVEATPYVIMQFDNDTYNSKTLGIRYSIFDNLNDNLYTTDTYNRFIALYDLNNIKETKKLLLPGNPNGFLVYPDSIMVTHTNRNHNYGITKYKDIELSDYNGISNSNNVNLGDYNIDFTIENYNDLLSFMTSGIPLALDKSVTLA